MSRLGCIYWETQMDDRYPWMDWTDEEWKEFLGVLPAAVDRMIENLAMPFADYDDRGNLIGGGVTAKGTERKYAWVLATNDAANHLQEWMNEQVDMRNKAAQNAGLSVMAFKGADEAEKKLRELLDENSDSD